MPQPSLGKQFADGLANAINDVREKFIEEPAYGRSLHDEGISISWPDAKEQQPEQGMEAKEPEIDIDR